MLAALNVTAWCLSISNKKIPLCSDDFDIEAHNRHRAALQKTNFYEFWFDITLCHSISLFDIQLPWVIAGFGRGKIVNYESQAAGQGYSVAYHRLFHPISAEATVYFYTNCDTEIPDDCDDEKIIDAFRRTIDNILFTNKNRFKSECNVVHVGKYTVHDERDPLLHVEFDIVSSREQKQSHMFFRGHRGRYLKVRISLPVGEAFKELPFKFVQDFADCL